MIPKKPNDLIKELANTTGHSEDMIKEVVAIYWKQIRKELSSLQHTGVVADKLGTFEVKHWKIEETLRKLEDKMRNLNVNTFSGYEARKEYLEKHRRLITLQEKFDEEARRKKEVRSSRNDKCVDNESKTDS